MRAPLRRRLAALLAATALAGLVAAPLAHAELHAHEADQARHDHFHELDAAVLRALSLLGDSSRDADAVGTYLRDHVRVRRHYHAHKTGAPQPRPHSHGQGPHGAGTLQHLGVALLAPARPADLPKLLKPTIGTQLEYLSLHSTPRYLSPDRSQGPPEDAARC